MHSDADRKAVENEVVLAVRPDPAVAAQQGDTLRFTCVLAHLDIANQRAIAMKEWQVFEGMLLALFFSHGGSITVFGSGVLVAPAIALCASHVIAPHMNGLLAGQIPVLCFGVASHGAQGWRVRHIRLVDRCNICFLCLEYCAELPPDKTFYHASITTSLPAIGENVALTGFRAPGSSLNAAERTEVRANVIVSSGAVTQRFPLGRNRLLAPWPCLEIDCPAWGGMSGGPVFDSRGYLIGLVARSMETADEPSPTVVSLPWPILGHKVQAGWPPSPELTNRSLLEITDTQACRIERADAVSIRAGEQEGQIITEYTPWT